MDKWTSIFEVLDNLSEAIKFIQAQIAEIKSELADHKERITKLENKRKTPICNGGTKRMTLAKLAELMQAGFSGVNQRLDNLEERVTVIEQDISILKVKVSNLEEDVKILKVKVSEIEKDVSVLKAKALETDKDISALKQAVFRS